MPDELPLRILLVEDNPGDARLIEEMLTDACTGDWRLDQAGRLADALAQLAEQVYDVVLLDLSLPDTHGFETVGKVLSHMPSVPIVVLTGLDDESVAIRTVQAGAQDYLVKSDVTDTLLIRSIRYAIERKRAESERLQLLARERAARAQAETDRARFRTILDAAPGGVIYVEAMTGRIVANAEASRLFDRSLSPAGGVSQYVGDLYRPGGHCLELDELPSRRALRGESVGGEEYVIAQHDGSRLPVVISAAPVWDADGQITGAVSTFHDISAIKELERLREEWTSVIAHDLRQPISIITTLASALQDRLDVGVVDSGDARAMMHIGAAAGRLDKMINDLLDYSLIEASSLRLDLQPVQLGDLVREIVERSSETTGDHPVRVHVAEAIPEIQADPGRLDQVLGNLLSNAAKYSSPAAPIDVTVTAEGEHVRLVVSNQGVGIVPEELPSLFTRFHRTEAVRSRRIAGLGLGLYLTKGLVEAHGGRIWAESEPGKTTSFHVLLPVAPAAALPELTSPSLAH